MLLARGQISFSGNERSVGPSFSGVLHVLLDVPAPYMVAIRRKHVYYSYYAVCVVVILHNVRAIVR
jgi:hypothetical protein